MTERADGRNLLLIGTEGLGLQSLRTAVRDDPTLIPVGRIDHSDSEHDGPDPHLVVLDTSALESDVAISAVAKAVLRWPRAGILAIAASAEPQLVRLDAGTTADEAHEGRRVEIRGHAVVVRELVGFAAPGFARFDVGRPSRGLLDLDRRDVAPGPGARRPEPLGTTRGSAGCLRRSARRPCPAPTPPRPE